MDVQADLSHHWVHMSDGTFSHIVAGIFLEPVMVNDKHSSEKCERENHGPG